MQSYIESGILELYVIGDLSPNEKLEVEKMAKQYPQVKANLILIQRALEGYADAYSVKPAEHLRERILNNLFTPIESGLKKEEIKNTQRSTVLKPNFPYKYAFAASVALLLISIVALFVTVNSNIKLASNNQIISKNLNDTQLALNTLRDPEVKLVKLEGTAKAPLSNMMIAFNPVKEEVMIDMATMNMPANDSQHQYQLWALVNGNPVNLGVFDMDQDSIGMKKMKTIGLAQAFAVTLEPRGGSANPTMDQMMAMGDI